MSLNGPLKILLLNGPCTEHFARTGRWQATSRGASLWYPIWLASATSVLEENGHITKLVDSPAAQLNLKETIDLIRDFAPDLCVIDTSTASIFYDLRTAFHIKKDVSPQIRVCMVGPHASAVPDDLIVNESVDFVAIGEFDYTVRDLVERLAKDIEDDGDGILGLWCNVDEKIIKNGPRDLIRNLDELPFASKAIFNHLYLNHYELDFTLHPYMDIMTSRGCPSKCTYCLWPQTITRGKYRMRSLENVFSEIEFTLSQNIKINEFFFDDDTFTIQPDRIKEFCARYSHMKTGIPFSVNSKANITDENLLMTMKKTGLRCLVVGFESGNQDILDNVKKGTRLIEMKTFADLCHKIGIQVHGDFVLGLTGETKETIDETIRFAKTLNLSTFQVSIAHPLPGTAFYNWLDEKGYITTHDYADWIDDNGAQNCIISYPNLSSEEIEESIDYAISKYYFSSHMLKTATRQILNDPHEIYRYARGAKRLARYFFNNSFSGDHFFKKS